MTLIHTTHSNIECYDWLAEHYSAIYGDIDAVETVRQWWDLCANYLPCPATETRLLDLGCGPGSQLRAWQSLGMKVAGLDSSPSMLAIARNHLGAAEVPLYQKDIRNQIMGIAPVDLVVSHFNFVNLFSPSERPQLFAAVYSLLKPGGLWMFDFSAPPVQPSNQDDWIDSNQGPLHRVAVYDATHRQMIQSWSTSMITHTEKFWLDYPEQLPDLLKSSGLIQVLRTAWQPWDPDHPWRTDSNNDETFVDLLQRPESLA